MLRIFDKIRWKKQQEERQKEQQPALPTSAVPTVWLRVWQADATSISVEPLWNVPPSMIKPERVKGYVQTRSGELRPGLTPRDVTDAIGHIDKPQVLTGKAAAHFRALYQRELRPYVIGCVEGLNMEAPPPVRNAWVLVAESRPEHGVGCALGVPMLACGKQLLSLPEAERLRDTYEYRDIPQPPVAEPVRLRADQILCGGDDELQRQWQQLIVNGPAWYTGKRKHQAAREHLDWLLHWGISGGLCGGYEAALTYGVPMLRRLVADDPAFTAFVAGSAGDLEELKNACPDLRDASYITWISPRTEAMPRKADLTLLIEPETAFRVKMKRGVMIQLVCRCRIGFFGRTPQSMEADEQKRVWASLGYEGRLDLLPYLVRNIRVLNQEPPQYRFCAADPELNQAKKSVAKTSEPILKKQPKTAPVSVPKPKQPPAIVLDHESIDRLRGETDQVRNKLLGTLPDDDAPKPIPAKPQGHANPAVTDGWQKMQERVPVDVLQAFLDGREALKACARARRTMPDLLLDEVNNAAMDLLGDLIADENGVLDDYRAALTEMMQKER